MKPMIRQSSASNQGFVLVTALIFLLVLSMLSILALRSTSLDERVAGNVADMALARQNAELALRDAERDLQGQRYDGVYCSAQPAPINTAAQCTNLRQAGTRPINLTDSMSFWPSRASEIDSLVSKSVEDTSDANIGVYSSQAINDCGKALWLGANWNDGSSTTPTCSGVLTTTPLTVAYGTYTNAQAPAGVTPPRYMIELLTPMDLKLRGKSSRLVARITAVGFGRTTTVNGRRTSVTLQTIYTPV